MTAEMKSMLRQKNRLMRKGRVPEAEAIAVKIGKMIITHNTKRFTTLTKDDSKSLWREVNSVINRTGTTVVNKAGLGANDLNDHYADTSTDGNYIAPKKKQTCNQRARNFVDEYTVFMILDRLKNSSSEPDVFPAWFLRLAAPFISRSLAHVYNLSLSSGTVPAQWKNSIIPPVAKNKDPAVPQNYRPISVTSILSRKLEHYLVTKYIYPSILNPTSSSTINMLSYQPDRQLQLLLLQSITSRNCSDWERLLYCCLWTSARRLLVSVTKHCLTSMNNWTWWTVCTTG